MAYSMDLIAIHSYTRQLITAVNAFEINVIADASYKEILPMDGFRHFQYFVNTTNELKHIVKWYVRLSDLNSLPKHWPLPNCSFIAGAIIDVYVTIMFLSQYTYTHIQ